MSENAAALHRALGAEVATLDLGSELTALRSTDSFRESDHAAKTLAKHMALRVVLVAMKGGGRLDEHHTDSSISVQCLEGHLRLEVGGMVHELRPGLILMLIERLPHSVTALDESAFLLTIGEQHHAGDPSSETSA